MKNPFASSYLLKIENPDCVATILFCDTRDYTKFATALTPVEVVERINSYSKIVINTVEENHGTVSKFIGDALLVYWLKEKHADHAALSCRFTASIQEQVSVLPFEIKTIVGIHTGHVALVSIDHGTYHSLEPLGDAVNTASRLNGACSHYNVRALASEPVIHQANGMTGWNNLGPIMIKGKNDPLTLYGLT